MFAVLLAMTRRPLEKPSRPDMPIWMESSMVFSSTHGQDLAQADVRDHGAAGDGHANLRRIALQREGGDRAGDLAGAGGDVHGAADQADGLQRRLVGDQLAELVIEL